MLLLLPRDERLLIVLPCERLQMVLLLVCEQLRLALVLMVRIRLRCFELLTVRERLRRPVLLLAMREQLQLTLLLLRVRAFGIGFARLFDVAQGGSRSRVVFSGCVACGRVVLFGVARQIDCF